MEGLAAFGLRNWQAIAGALVAAILLVMLTIRTDQRDDARAATTIARLQTATEIQRHVAFAAQVAATAERLRNQNAQTIIRVEREQARISQESDHVYQERIADLRRRVADLRLRGAGTAGDARSGDGGGAMPGAGAAAGEPDGAAGAGGLPAALTLAEREQCTEIAIRLEELQRWVRAQLGIDRTAEPVTGGN